MFICFEDACILCASISFPRDNLKRVTNKTLTFLKEGGGKGGW